MAQFVPYVNECLECFVGVAGFDRNILDMFFDISGRANFWVCVSQSIKRVSKEKFSSIFLRVSPGVAVNMIFCDSIQMILSSDF